MSLCTEPIGQCPNLERVQRRSLFSTRLLLKFQQVRSDVIGSSFGFLESLSNRRVVVLTNTSSSFSYRLRGGAVFKRDVFSVNDSIENQKSCSLPTHESRRYDQEEETHIEAAPRDAMRRPSVHGIAFKLGRASWRKKRIRQSLIKQMMSAFM